VRAPEWGEEVTDVVVTFFARVAIPARFSRFHCHPVTDLEILHLSADCMSGVSERAKVMFMFSTLSLSNL
jgi:hypothetical protein